MHLLLTTSQSFLLLDTDSGLARQLDTGRGLYYGIARHGEHLYVAARQRLVSSSVDPAEERGEILMFDRRLRACGSLRAPFPLRDLHEIAWHDGRLYCTASHDNMVAVYDGRQWQQWYPLGEAGVGDQNHFNSFLFEDGVIWILAHNRGDSELLAFSLDSRALLRRQTLGNCAHNIWRENGHLYTCSSAESRIVGEDGFVLETGGFPRGIAFDGASRCVGVSTLIERKARDFSDGLVQVRQRDWRDGHEIALDQEGLVLDLMTLPDGFALPADGLLQRAGRRLGLLPAAPATLRFARRPAPAA
jgi:hypothetical protein